MYNGEKFLKEQVDSVLQQTYSPIELIIADDASTDESRKVLNAYEHHPGVKIIYRDQNIGVAKNFALAAGQAKGEFIAFSDQDDIWKANKIERLVAAIGAKPLVYSDSILIDKDGRSLGKKLSRLKNMYSGSDSRGYMFYSCVWGHGMLITRDLLLTSLPMPEKIHHDIWLAFIAFQHGGICFCDEALTYYRRHDETNSIALPERVRQRRREQRYHDYEDKLEWIRLMRDRERAEYKPFFNEMVRLYELKAKRNFVWPLFFFMLKHRKAIFRLTNKNFFSQLAEILKQARGEKL